MAERTKCGGHGRTRQLFFALGSFFQRQVRVARLAVIVAVSAIAFLLGIVLFSYGSRLYEDWRETRLLNRATALLQEGKLSKRPRRRESWWHDILILCRRFTS